MYRQLCIRAIRTDLTILQVRVTVSRRNHYTIVPVFLARYPKPDTRYPKKLVRVSGLLPVTHTVHNLTRVPPNTHSPKCIFPQVQCPAGEERGFSVSSCQNLSSKLLTLPALGSLKMRSIEVIYSYKNLRASPV